MFVFDKYTCKKRANPSISAGERAAYCPDNGIVGQGARIL